ncbi:MAG: hypothetical protein DHS20C11_37600 [Lysobacteraceae bacterium]|nr:MAG: hypothetical protein DHS20C11_37600 [Xanthomonadaceae bacterium]
MIDQIKPAFLAILVLLSAAACQMTPSESPRVQAEPAVDAELDDDSVIGVFPLQSSAVETLIAQAEQQLAAGDLEAAERTVEEAIGLAPDDTALWQQLAEIRLRRGHYNEAISAAQHSYLHGPQVGPLCEKNWRTIAESQQLAGWADAAADSRQRAEQCRVKARPRL